MTLNRCLIGLSPRIHTWSCLCFAWLHLSAVAADDWKAVFDPYQVVTLHLQMSNSDWDRVRHDQPSQDEGWVPEVAEALMWGDGETPLSVTVRRKGQSDTPLPEGNPQKVSLKIDVNALVDGQKWRGLNKLSLENGSENPLSEGFAWIAHRLAWEAGIYDHEAAYSGWVRLYVNGELKGIFVNAEQRDAQFLRNHGYDKGPSTWLYKVDGSSSLEVGIGDSPTRQHLCYAPFNSGPGGGGNGGCPQPNLEVDLPQWINVRGFFTLAAVEAFLENKDGLFTHSGKNSYAVDFDPPFPRTRLYFPWDQDTTIFQGNASIYGNEPYQTQLLMHPWFGRVYEQLLRDLLDGPFSPAALRGVIDRIEAGVGAAFDEDPYVYGGDSSDAFDELRRWVDTRVANVRGQLTQPYLPRPVLNHAGGEVVAGFNLTMSAPTGTVYYTLDGSDPRAPGGAVAASAQIYTAPIVIDRTTHIVARAFNGTLWSPLPATATFNIARYANALRITELMYHPARQSVAGDEDNYEFLELKNTGATPLNLSGFYFEGITFAFPAGTILAPNSFFVLARSQAAFSGRYPGITVNGIYTAKLDDGGEKIRLRNSDGNTVVSVEYEDDPPWPLAPDGLGYSLVLADSFSDPDQPDTWRASSQFHGSPGADDPAPSYGLGVVINEVLAHTDPPFEDAIELHNAGPAPVDISGWFLSDDFVRTNAAGSYGLKKYRVPPNTVIPAGGFKVFYERDFRINNSLAPFALTEFGETVYLSSATAAGVLNGYIMGATFGASDRGVSLGRHQTSRGIDFVALNSTTFGLDNPATLNDFRSGSGAANSLPRIGPVVISEIMYNPTGAGSEFIELLSVTNGPTDLSGWTVAGTAFTFPPGVTLPAHGLLLLLKTNATSAASFRSTYSVPGAVPIFAHDFVLENEGEALRLEKPNPESLMPAIEMERVRYNDKSPWPTEADGEGPSLERFSANEYGNDPINWRTVAAGGSPGRLNVFNAGVAVARNSSWNYHAQGSDLGTPWREPDYVDSGWPSGDGVLGYGASALGTIIPYGPSSTDKPITVYFRKEFVVNDPLSAISNLRLDALYDDGFVLYLNGVEVLRSASMPGGAIAFNTPASGSYNSIGHETFDLSAHIPRLRLGNNVICAEVHQESRSSDDLLWDASLTFDVSTQPTVALPSINPNGGAFTAPVQVTISAVPLDAAIYYTINGTDPDESSARYTSPFFIETTAELRARAFKPGYNESGIASASFVFAGPGVLDVQPGGGVIASGTTGGPFTPPATSYVLTNSGGLSLNWTARVSETWINLSLRSGVLAPGATTNVIVSFSSAADMLPVGEYNAAVEFANATGAPPISRPVALTVSPIRMSLISSAGELTISLQGQNTTVYIIESSSNLLHWTPIATNAAGPDGRVNHVDTPAAEAPRRFYRARPQR